MKKRTLLLALALALSLLSGCGQTPVAPSAQPQVSVSPEVEAPLPPEPPAPPTHAQQAAALVSKLSLAEKAGQIFFARCPATGAAEAVREYRLGGVLLFSREFKDKTADELIQSNRAMQNNAAIPLLIGVDEEGGTVVRASSNPKLRANKYQSPQKVFAGGSWEAIVEDTAQKDAFLMGLGVNVNLAPVADVSTSAEDFIYDRTFGKSAEETARFTQTVVAQMAADGMGSALKHFPGYGNNVDTHTGISLDTRPLDSFRAADFLPFQSGIAAGEGTVSVLVSHNIMTAVDESLPASLSPAVHALLREELDFDGVVMTDDLVMDAVKAYADNGSAAVLAVVAGNDLLISSDFQTDIAAVIAAVEAGTISQQRLDEAVLRVLVWKMELGLL